MLEGIPLWEIIVESVGWWRNSSLDDLSRHRLIRRLIGLSVSDLVNSTSQRLDIAGVGSVLELQSLDYNLIGYSEDMHRRNRELKDFLYSNLYRHYRVVRMQVKAERILSELFAAYQAEPSMLPNAVQETFEARGQERAICDYIAGMTDRFAIEEYNKLYDPLVRP